ncbi:MAG: hypothetical protein KGZ97_10160 [Bacteroidetes bacterium]|nr:hypothetical protein [Bacteroidota bacterium]
MKNLLIIVFFSTVIFAGKLNAQCGDALLDACHSKLGETRFLKSFPVQLEEQKPGTSLPVVRYSIVFNAGTTYRIFACNAQEFPGKVIFSLNFQDKLLVTSFSIDSKTHFPHIDFPCNMSGLYHIDFYFEEGKKGCAVGVVSSSK